MELCFNCLNIHELSSINFLNVNAGIQLNYFFIIKCNKKLKLIDTLRYETFVQFPAFLVLE